MKDLMIDLETLGTGTESVVLSIGACFFDVKTLEIGETFYAVIDIGQQLDKGRRVDSSTLQWWMGQSNAAKSVFTDQPQPTVEVLRDFVKWVVIHSTDHDVHPWGNGSTFDISIIESLFKQFNVPVPWNFFNVMDLRTFRRFVAGNAKVQKLGTNHNALDDAMSQANFILEMLGNEREEKV